MPINAQKARPPDTTSHGKLRIVFLDRRAISVPLRAPAFAHEWQEYQHTPPELTAKRLEKAQIAITNRVPITRAVLEAAPELQLIAVSATGYEHVDMDACRERSVLVCNVRDWAVSVPEHVFALILALRRQLPSYQRAVAEGAWQASATYGFLLPPLPTSRRKAQGLRREVAVIEGGEAVQTHDWYSISCARR